MRSAVLPPMTYILLLTAATVFSLISIGSGAFRDQLPREEVDWRDVDGDSVEQADNVSRKIVSDNRESLADRFMGPPRRKEITNVPTIMQTMNSCQTKKGGFETRPYDYGISFCALCVLCGQTSESELLKLCVPCALC